MQWFYNMKISAKLLSGFILIALIAATVGIVGISNLNKISDSSTVLYEENTLGIEYAGNAANYFQRIRFNLVKMLIVEDISDFNTCTSNIENYIAVTEENLKLYEEGIITSEDREAYDKLKPQWDEYVSLVQKTVSFAKNGEIEEAKYMVLVEIGPLGNMIREGIGVLVNYNSEGGKTRAAANDALADKANLTMIIAVALGVLIAILLGIFIARSISRPVNHMVEVADKLAEGDLDVNIDATTKDEIGELMAAFNRMIINTQDQARAAEKIANGDLSVDIKVRSEADILNIRLNEMSAAIRLLISEMNKLNQEQKAGDIDYYMDIEQFRGAYRDVANGVNEGYRLNIDDLLNILGVLTSYAEGDFTPKLTQLPGKKALANEKLDLLRSNLLAVIDEMLGVAEKAIDGDLAVRGQANKFAGDYNKIVAGLNEILEAIIQPINESIAALAELAKGNLDVGVRGNYKGDHALMKDAINTTVNAFNEVLGNINSASEQVASGAEQLSASSIALSQGATEQASSVEELTASVEQIAVQTQTNAENAGIANQLAEQAKNHAMQGNSQMQEMLVAMEEINEASANISKIIKVIDDIAFQTNILALNAAVEAARAGQHGKGFAVVAEEVRNLAARSANAARETTDMIEGSIKKVEGGTRMANETAKALEEIVGDVAKAAELVNSIAVASNEQAIGVAQINQGIMQVSQVVQTNSATSEESAAASEELSSQAELLQEQVGKFRLKTVQSHYNHNAGGGNYYDGGRNNNVTAQPANKEKDDMNVVLSDIEFGKY